MSLPVSPDESLTQQLVERIRSVSYDDLPTEAVEVARHVFLDGAAVTIAGVSEPSGLGRLLIGHAQAMAGPPHASVVGGGFRTSMTEAAFVNGTLAHALDFDNCWYPLNHPTSPTLPAILAFAERFGSSGRDCLTALVVGFEVQARLRRASTGLRTGRGFHKPGTTGLMGAVAAVVKLLDLDDDRAVMAFGIAGSRVGSLSLNTGTMTKATHSGHAARMGLESALLAERGWTASRDVFGPGGYFDTLLGDDHEAPLLVEGFGRPLWMVDPGVGFKKHPSNYFTHRPIDAALELRTRPEFSIDQVERITIRFPDLHYVDRPHPDTGLDGKFSLQYTTVVALLDGAVTIDSFTDERRFQPDVESLLPRVEIEFDPTISREFLELDVEVTAHLRDGTALSEHVGDLTGMPGVPLTERQRLDKFFRCAERVVPRPAAERLAHLLSRVDELRDLSEVMDIMRCDDPSVDRAGLRDVPFDLTPADR